MLRLTSATSVDRFGIHFTSEETLDQSNLIAVVRSLAEDLEGGNKI